MDEISYRTREGSRRRGDMMERPATRLTTALVLMGLGVVFLLDQFGVLVLSGNWWAFFIAIPAIAMFYAAFRAYSRDGRMNPEVGSNMMGGIIFAGVTLMAWFGAWEWFLPFILITIGLTMFMGWRTPEHSHPG